MAQTRQTPKYGNLPHVRDPVLRQLLQGLADRISEQDRQLQELRIAALQTTTTTKIDAQNQRVINALDPRDPQDLVTKRYFDLILNNQIEVLRRQIAASGGDGGLGPTGPGSDPPTVPLPNFYAEVVAYAQANAAALANSCVPPKGTGTWEYLNGLVLHLRAIDPRIGWNGKRANVDDPSADAIAYYHGFGDPIDGSNNVYVIDVISCHCGPEENAGCLPGPAWKDQTGIGGAGGAWLESNPVSP